MEVRINLIPEYKKEEIRSSRRLRIVFNWETQLTAVAVVFTAILLSIVYILKINLSAVTGDIPMQANNKHREIEKYDAEIKEMNAQLAEIEMIQGSQLYWSGFFLKLNARVLEGIEIEELSTQDYAVTLEGRADTRDKLIMFKESLEKEGCFKDVKLPLSSLVSKDNVNFQLDFHVEAECLMQ